MCAHDLRASPMMCDEMNDISRMPKLHMWRIICNTLDLCIAVASSTFAKSTLLSFLAS